MIDISPDQHNDLRRRVIYLTEVVGMSNYDPLTPAEAQSQQRLGRRNIVGFGYGVKTVAGRPVDRIAITGYVVRKAPEYEVEPDFAIDQFIRRQFEDLPRDVETDVIEVGNPIPYFHANVTYPRRIPGGAAISSALHGVVGTIGGWASTQRNEVLLLSCWHILDGGHAQVGIAKIAQPNGNHYVGTLAASAEPHFSPHLVTVDAALAALDHYLQDAYSDFILGIGDIRGVTDATSAPQPIHVRKFGVNTHLSHGALINATGSMSMYYANERRYRKYALQYVVQPIDPSEPFALPGDSGALLVTDDHLAIGLLVGGQPGGTAFATPIAEVLASLGQQLNTTIGLLTYP